MWIPAPQSGVTVGKTLWQAGGTFLNGGGWSDNSGASHEEIKMAWGLMSTWDAAPILQLLQEEGPFYYLDPVAAPVNILPPYVAGYVKDNPFGATKSSSIMEMARGDLGPMLSKDAAKYSKETVLWDFPIPPGYSMFLEWCGYGSLSINGQEMFGWMPSDAGSEMRFSMGGGQHVYVTAKAGTEVTNITAIIQKNFETLPTYKLAPGMGRSQLALSGPVQISQYSAVINESNLSLSADFREVGAWL